LKILRVGDPHAKINNLTEMSRLLGFVLETAKLNEVDRIEILGDLYHTHAVLRLEVQEFWTRTLKKLSESFETVVLVGNHDMSGNYNSEFSALSIFSLMNVSNLIIIENPLALGIFGYVPYTHQMDRFVDASNVVSAMGAKVLVCHQTLQGCRYESGFYAADGIPTGDWSAKFAHIISGHIHSEQAFENIIYPGTARWDGVVDANLRKGIWIYEHDDVTGQIKRADFISTENVCSPLKSISYNEGDRAPDVWADNVRVTLELSGSSEWIDRQKKIFKGKVSFRTKIADGKKLENRRVAKNLEDFIQNASISSNKENLIKLAKELQLV
jgi:Calcineurin-like phosphoesterase